MYIILFLCVGLLNALPINYEFQPRTHDKLTEELQESGESEELEDYFDDKPPRFNKTFWQMIGQKPDVRLTDSDEEIWKSPMWMSDEEDEWEVLPKNPQPPPKYLKLIVIISSVALLSTILILVCCVLLDDPNKDDDEFEEDEEKVAIDR